MGGRHPTLIEPGTVASSMTELLSQGWIFGDSRFLWLLPLALLPLWRGKLQDHRVASTTLWLGLSPGTRSKKRWLLPLWIFIVLFAAAEPTTISTLPSIQPVGISVIQSTAVLELYPECHDWGQPVTVATTDGDRVLTIESVPPDTGLSIPLSSSLSGSQVVLSFGKKRTIKLRVPTLPPPPEVLDQSGSPAIDRALEALIATGHIDRWISKSPPTEPDVEIIRQGSDPRSTRSSVIEFPDLSTPLERFLPIPQRTDVIWLAGLAAEEWTIEGATEISPRSAEERVPLRDERNRPLIVEGPQLIRFAFRPEESDLPNRIEWPVLLGRAIEEVSRSPRSLPTSSKLPTIVLVLAALGILPSITPSKSMRRTIALLLLLTLFLPPIVGGSTPRRSIEPNSPPLSAILDAAAKLPHGGIVTIPSSLPIPLEIAPLFGRLTARSVTLELTDDGTPRLELSRRSVHIDEPMQITGVNEEHGLIYADAPDGTTLLVGDLDEPPLEHRPDQPGVWRYRLESATKRGTDSWKGIEAWLEVEPPIEVLTLKSPNSLEREQDTTGSASLFRSEAVYRNRGGLALGDLEELTQALPDPTRSLLVWDDVEPEELTTSAADSLRNWIEAGGTLFTIAGPPWRGARTETLLDDLLPAPLPPPPEPPKRDHGILLLDLSGSLAGEPISTLWAGVTALLESTPTEDRWAVAGFREIPHWIIPPGTIWDPSRLAEIEGAIGAGGGTRLDRALEFCLRAIEETETLQRSIVLVTDGRSTPADWRALGTALKNMEIELTIVSIGGMEKSQALTTLARETNGNIESVADASAAVRTLGRAIIPFDSRWEPVQNPLRALGSWSQSWPAAISGPRRRISETLINTSPGGSTDVDVQLVDAAGAPLVTTRFSGQGRTIEVWFGLDGESLPKGGSGSRLLEALSEAIARTIRGIPRSHRDCHWRVDRQGRWSLSIDRHRNDPPRMEGTWQGWHQDRETRIATADSPRSLLPNSAVKFNKTALEAGRWSTNQFETDWVADPSGGGSRNPALWQNLIDQLPVRSQGASIPLRRWILACCGLAAAIGALRWRSSRSLAVLHQRAGHI